MNKKFSQKDQIVMMTIILIGSFCLALHLTQHVPHDEGESFTEVEMNVSAYCPCEKCCENFADGITASGSTATGKLIAAPRNYAFGTRMDVPGYGTALVEDRGGAIKDNKIDLLFSSHHDALVWGRQYLTVKVYAKAGE
jgi:3D (Asp-Asp-Asp) domain-containing protein